MKVEITTRNYNVSEHLERIANQKLSKLDKYFANGETTVKVSFKKEANSCVTEVMLEYGGKYIRATASSDNFYDNLDIVLPKIEGQIRKRRTIFDKNKKNTAFEIKGEFDGEEKWEEMPRANVVKEKKFKLSPLTLDEAIAEMDMLGHDFYVFLDAKTHTVQVLYLRKDGELGHIQPEI